MVEELIYAAVSEAEGCTSAEHGIGVIKEPFLHYGRSEPEIEVVKKRTFLVRVAALHCLRENQEQPFVSRAIQFVAASGR
jgi:hypothetical protein